MMTSSWVSDYLDSKSPAIRAASVVILGKLGADYHAEHIESMLTDSIIEVRKSAIHALAEIGYRKSYPEMLKLLDDADSSVRRSVLDAMVALGINEAAPVIANMISDPDARVGSTAIRSLEALGEIDILNKTAIMLLESQQARDRIRAAHILLDHPVPDAADTLIKALDDEIGNVVFTSAQVLAHLKRKEAIPVLAGYLDKPGFYKKQAVEALVKIDDPSAASYIRKAISEGDLDQSYTGL